MSSSQPAPATTSSTTIDPDSLLAFKSHLETSKRILIIVGAGLSASSGIPTFRDTLTSSSQSSTSSSHTPLWQSHDIHLVATPAGFRRDPGLVWQFYSARRRAALRAQPNAAHRALAEFVRLSSSSSSSSSPKEILVASQNVDGLLERCGLLSDGDDDFDPTEKKEEGEEEEEKSVTVNPLKRLHGSLFSVRCTNSNCSYSSRNNFEDPIQGCQVLSEGWVPPPNILGNTTSEEQEPAKANALLFEAIRNKNAKILGPEKFVFSDPTVQDGEPLKAPSSSPDDDQKKKPLIQTKEPPSLHSGISPEKDLPKCPLCSSLLRPGVVWFGEGLPLEETKDVEEFIRGGSGDDDRHLANEKFEKAEEGKEEEEQQQQQKTIDLVLVIGTSSKVWPAAGYAEEARSQSRKSSNGKSGKITRVATVNTNPEDAKNVREGDWVFVGDAAELVPRLLLLP